MAIIDGGFHQIMVLVCVTWLFTQTINSCSSLIVVLESQFILLLRIALGKVWLNIDQYIQYMTDLITLERLKKYLGRDRQYQYECLYILTNTTSKY